VASPTKKLVQSSPPTARAAHDTPRGVAGGDSRGTRTDTNGLLARCATPLAIVVGAVALRVASGVGFANYDTLYALVWGQQLTRGETPQYGIPIAPTPHPLVEALGVLTAPLGPHASEQIAVALGFLALAACGWAVYRLGALWFNRPAGAVAALLLLTREPILSYGVRAYVDVPYLLLVLSALIVETRRRRAGAPVLVLLALAGLLRPEAWAFSGLYWLYLALPLVRARRGPLARTPRTSGQPGAVTETSRAPGTITETSRAPGAVTEPSRAPGTITETSRAPGAVTEPACAPGESQRTPGQLAWLALLAAAAPIVWVTSDWLVTGNPLWSLTNTRHTAETLHRETGIAKVPEYIPRRIGEVLGPFALVPAAFGGVLTLMWLRARALAKTGTDAAGEYHPAWVGVIAGIVAVMVFAAFASVGLPIDTRYAFLAAAILCVFAGAAVCGWMELPRGDPHRRWWRTAAAVSVVALAASIPFQYRIDHRELNALGRQQRIQNELTALVRARAIAIRCEPIGVTNHAPVPLLALWLEAPPSEIANLQTRKIAYGTFVDPANAEVQDDYILDRNDPHESVAAPTGFTVTHTNRSWRILQRCANASGG
jgi:hypothetical protein